MSTSAAPVGGDPVVSIRDLVIEYRTSGYAVRPIDGLDLDASAGELVVLLGPSGCGKTSLLSVVGGILRPASGSVTVAGRRIDGLQGAELAEHRQRTVGFVFQAFNLVASLSARENVAVPLLLAGWRRRDALRRADALLDRVGLADRRHHLPARLSGGQQQRVAVARGLAADPPVLLADEPTANLDYVQAESIISLLRDLRADGRVILVSSHDDRLVPIADRVVHLVPEHRADAAPPHLVELAADEVLFRQGDRAELVYVVLSGEVVVSREGDDGVELELASVGPGDYVGELGPLLGFPRSATATARTPAQLRAYSVQDFRDLVLTPPESADGPTSRGAARPGG